MARALVVTGLDPERAYLIARRPIAILRSGVPCSLDLDRLGELAAELIGEEEAARTVRRLRRLDALQRIEEPLLLLVGGATGTGKSTIATEAAHRLGITRVTSTDFIRQTMRTFFSKEFMPSVHYSSFEARLALTRAEEEESGDAAILGFLDQTRNVLVGVDAALERAATERWSTVLEGVHLVPGMVGTRVSRRVRRPVHRRDRGREPPPQPLLGTRSGHRGPSAAREVPRLPPADPRDPGLPGRAGAAPRRPGDLQRLARPRDRRRAGSRPARGRISSSRSP